MFGWLRKKTDAELLEERIDRIENEVARVAKERRGLETRAASEVAKRRAMESLVARVKSKTAIGGGLIVGAVIVSALWDKVILFVSFSFTQLLWFALAAFVCGWLLVHFAWPNPQT